MERTLIPTEMINSFCRQNHISGLSLFGSIVREDFTPDSDIDILKEFEEGHTPGLDFFRMEDELSRLMKRKVDLQTRNFLSADILKNALSEEVEVYEQA